MDLATQTKLDETETVAPEETGLDKERWLAKEISDRVNRHNLNAICIWVGPTGGGKSYSALRLGELVDSTFNVRRVVFRPLDFLDLINETVDGTDENGEESQKEALAKGSVVLWDEMGLGMPARNWQDVFNKSIGYVLQSFRFRNIALFMTVPDQAFIDTQARRLFHYFFECVSINREQSFVLTKPFEVQHSARFDKDYIKYPIVKLETGPAQVGTVPFHLPSEGLRNAYEAKRKAYMESYYRELRESLEVTGEGAAIPLWAWRAILELAEGRNQAEVAGILQVSREWANKLLRRAKAAIRTA